MNKDLESLSGLLREGKISEKDYQLLKAAIDKKSPGKLSLLINPFQKIAGFHALIFGLLIMLCASFFGVLAKVYTIGVISSINASAIKNANEPHFLMLLYQNLLAWLALTALFILFSKIFQQKRLRYIDFFGTTALARYPQLFFIGFLAIMRTANPSFMHVDLSQGIDLHFSFLSIFFSVTVIACLAWQIITYFYALKEASGLLRTKLWINFIAALILGEIIVSPLSLIFI